MKYLIFFFAILHGTVNAQPWLSLADDPFSSTVWCASPASITPYRLSEDTIKPIRHWDTTGYQVTTYETKRFGSVEDDGSIIVFKQSGGDTLLEFDAATKMWVPSGKVLKARGKNAYKPGPLFKTRPKGTRRQVAETMMYVSIAGYFISGYHAGKAEWELSQSGWPRTKSAYMYRDASIWGDAGFAAMWGGSIVLNWNQEVRWKTVVRGVASGILCGLSRYGGTRLGYYKNDN